MSLILEALRKSEAERRRGLPPDLSSELPPPAPVRARRVPIGIVLAVPAALALAAWLWWPRQAALPERATAAAAPIDAPVNSRVDADAGPRETTQRDADVPAPMPTPTPTPRSTPEITAPAVPAPPASAPRPVASAPQPAPTPTIDAPPSPAPPPPAVGAPAAASPVSAPASTPAVAEPAAGRVTALADLDPETRKALPPLRLSMHMWNEAPSRRFAIVDGKRVAEGDRVGDATVARIEPDGLLLEWRGAGIRVPLR